MTSGKIKKGAQSDSCPKSIRYERMFKEFNVGTDGKVLSAAEKYRPRETPFPLKRSAKPSNG
jgi:hypothetical protein